MISIGPRIGIQGEAGFRNALREIRAESEKLGTQMNRLTETFTKNDDAIQRNVKTQKQLQTQLEVQQKDLQKNKDLLQLARDAYANQEAAIVKQQKHIGELKTSYDSLNSTIPQHKQALSEALEKLAELRPAYEQAQRNIAVLTEEFGESDGFTRAAAEAIAEYNAQAKEVESKETELKNTEEAFAKTGNAVKDAEGKLANMQAKLHQNGQYIQQWSNEVLKSEDSLRHLKEELQRAPDFVAEFNRNTVESNNKLENMRNSIELLSAEFERTEAHYTSQTSAVKKYADSQEYLNKRLEEERAIYRENTDLRNAATVAQENQEKALRSLEYQLQTAEMAYGKNSEQAQIYNKAIEEQKTLVHEAEKNTAKYNTEIARSGTEITKLERELAKGVNYIEEFSRKTEESERRVEKHEKALELLDSELEVQLSQYSKLQKYMVENARNRETLIKKIEEEKKVVAENTKLRDEAIKTEEKQRKEYERLSKELETQRKDYGEYNRNVIALNESVKEQAQLVHEAEMKTAEYTKAVNDAKLAQHELEEELKHSSGFATIGKVMSDVGEKMADFGEMMSKYVTAPLSALGTYAVKSAADFEDAMAKIYTIAIDSTEPMEKMHDELVRLSNDSGFDLSDLGEATYQAVSASVEAGEAVEFMGDATKLARAGFTSTTKAVDLLTTVINAYGMEASDASKISDILLKTQNDGKTVIDDLASSMGIIIPMASNYNVGLDQIAAAYATMTKQGVKTERATTFLRAVFTELEKESSDVAGILEDKTGKSFAQLMGEGKNLSDVLGILYKSVGGNNEEFQRLFGNVRATQAVASLVAGDINGDTKAFGMFNKELERVRDSAGQVDKALEVMETPALKARKAVNRLKNSAENLGETMIDMTAPAFEATVDKVRELTDGFIGMSDSSKKMIVKAGALAAAIGPVTLGIGKLMKYIGGLMMGTASWIPLLGAAVAGVIAVSEAIAVSNNEKVEAIRQEYGMSDAMKTEIEELRQLRDSHSEFQQSMVDRNTATLNQVSYVQELVAQYDGLVGKNGEVKASQQQLADHILNEIANALGIEVDQVKDLIDENGKLSKSIQQTIEDFKQQAQLTVLQEEFTEATHRKVEAEKAEEDITAQLAIASQKKTEADRELKAAQEAYNKELEQFGTVSKETRDRLVDANSKSNLATQTTKELKTALFEAKDMAGQASKDMDYYSQKIDELGDESKKTADQIEKDAKRSEKAIKDAGDNVVVSMDGVAKSAYKSGEMVARGFAAGIDDYAYLAGQASVNMGANASKNLNHSVQVKSPSRVTMETGKYFAQGFALGMENGIPMVNKMAERIGMGATDSLAYGSYLPEGAIGGSYSSSKTVNAPISLNVTVNGSVDDPDSFAKDIANRLTNLINRESEVFA